MFMNSNTLPPPSLDFTCLIKPCSFSAFHSPVHPNGSPESVSTCIHKTIVPNMKHTTNAFIYLTGISVTDHPTSAIGALEFTEYIELIMLISSRSN